MKMYHKRRIVKMDESNQVVLIRYYYQEEEFDVFINGEFQCMFVDTPYNLVQLLEKLGFKNIEKQSFTSR
jgi:hypothetical protein